MEFVREIIETTILTGRLREHSPTSLIIIAYPESGKTSIVLSKNCKSVSALTDVTSGGLRELCKNRPEVSHFILNDMVAVSAHKSSVVGATISMLNAMTEEGVMAVAYPGSVETFENGKRGIIASIPSGMIGDQRSWWSKTGFISRMLPINYQISRPLNIKINDYIRNGSNSKSHDRTKNPEFKVPDVPLSVAIPKQFTDAIQRIAYTTIDGKELGFRRHKQMRAMACAHAILRAGWKVKEIGKADIEFLENLANYVSFDKPYKI